MSNKTVFGQHNNNIRSQGGGHSWSADVDNEIYQNIDNLENAVGNIDISLNKIIRDDLPTKQNQINDILSNQLPQKQKQISELSSKTIEVQSMVTSHQMQIMELSEKFKLFETDALDKLAEHFESNSEKLKEQESFWKNLVFLVFKYVAGIDVFILILVFLTDKITISNSIYITLPINILAFTVVYFTVSQYSSYKKLALEYKNRSVVSRSYFGILNAANASEERNIITRIVADTLFSRNVTDQGSELPLKEISKVVDKIINK